VVLFDYEGPLDKDLVDPDSTVPLKGKDDRSLDEDGKSEYDDHEG